MNDRPPGWQFENWRASAAFRAMATTQIQKINKARWSRNRCGARKKRTGQPCQNAPMTNGKCWMHGGRTPKGKDWHRPLWPSAKSKAAMRKLDRKLADRARAEKRRAQRVAMMTPDERRDYETWRKTHKAGPPGPRAADRLRRQQDEFLRELMARPPNPPTAKQLERRRQIMQLEAHIAKIDERIAALDAQIAAEAQLPPPNLGVFE